MRFSTLIALICVLSAVGLTYEIAAGRVLAPFFGTSLLTWTAVIAVVLAGFSVGSAWGGLLAERPRPEALAHARRALIWTAVLAALSPTLLALVYALGLRGTSGMLLSVVVAFFPASVLVTVPSPLLAKLAVEARPGREGSSLGLVLAAGSLGAIVGAIVAGFVTLPLVGSSATFAGCGAVALICAALLRAPDARPDLGARAAMLTAAVVVAASLLTGPLCRFESGLSCIDVVRRGATVSLVSDRTQQAAERDLAPGADPAEALTLEYTRWLWQRMAQDLGAAPSVLFIGGGGYSLPTTLLATRPAATATAVEIDPLITEVVRDHLPRAGAMIDAEGRGDIARPALDGRLRVVHEDGRVFLNETDRRFDAAVIDAFSSGSVPAYLATLETYTRLRDIVNGPVYVNLIDRPNGDLARGVHAILTQIFPHVRAAQGPVSGRGLANILLAASRTPLEGLDAPPEGYGPVTLSDARAFTDDRGWVGHR